MGEKTGITWTDHTFNPWWGCEKVSPACAHCYAETFALRLGCDIWGGSDTPRRFFGDKHWNEPLLWNKRAKAEGVRRKVFCASMADVFENRPDLEPHRDRLWKLIDATPHLDWLLLTKRPQSIVGLYPIRWIENAPPNVWLGTTIEDESQYYRARYLSNINAVQHFISIEPMLSMISICGILDHLMVPSTRGLWIIVGGESGAHARPMDPEWVRSIMNDCLLLDIPFFFKQGSQNNWGKDFKNIEKLPEEFRVQQFPTPSLTLPRSGRGKS